MKETTEQHFRLILAYGSPRRRELLSSMGYQFEILVPDVDEHIQAPAREAVAILSQRKAAAVVRQIDSGIVIASDTLVSFEGQALGKPCDEDDAHRMLRMLSGQTHEVFTGVTLMDASNQRMLTKVIRTGVCFRTLSEDEIWSYIRTGEPMDKAGAYGIQGGAGAFVSSLDGSFENVMGFPVDDIRTMLDDFTKE